MSNSQLKTIFNQEVIADLAQRIKKVFPSFDKVAFEQDANQNLDFLELKQRSTQICNALTSYLPSEFEEGVNILVTAMGEDDKSGGLEGYYGFRFMPFLDFVAARGLNNPDIALDSLEKMTLHFSAEFAIRPFILKHPDTTLPRLLNWTSHQDWRVRRLASEGTRPRLPWGMQLKPFIENPSFVIRILNNLYNDPNLIVRRSVANNLNDIAKDNSDLAVETAQSWWDARNELAQWTVRHGLRTLVKQGNKKALSVLGFVGGDSIRVENFQFQPSVVKIGDELNFSCNLISEESINVNLVVDYVLHRVLANGKLSKKVFKLRQIELSPGEKITLSGKHKFKQLSTRTYYPGFHSIELVVNGCSVGKYDFELL
ncbi:DNA alkylation repair enzyme [Rivularia sp. PCC 7116]|uniref:DNA alkylation repair protein n=1 Tax=Rivularia sp. PCC 7116 TaxID=373994 RepID=UPI00029EFBAB|nr:DNA alkylation repair protein [Rivularia sp. PCC 7116]AFY56776.1 DNA alkylation repair enzyme [Rivularia sp. PCC 7116]